MKTYKTLIEVDTKDAKKSINDLKESVGDLTDTLTDLDGTSKAASNSIRSTTKDTTNLASALDQVVIDGERVGEVMGHISRVGAGLAGGFELVAGVMALAGKESEKYEETMRRVAGAMAITNSLSALGDAFESIAKLSPKAALAVEKFGKAVGGALKGIPGIVLAASAAIGALFIKIRRDSQHTERYISGVKDELASLVDDEEKEHTLHLSMLQTLQSNQPTLLEYFNKNKEAIEKVAGAHNDYNETIQAYIDKTPEYIEMIHKRAAAEKLMDDIVEHEIRIAKLRKEKEEYEAEAAKRQGTGLTITNPAGGTPISTGGARASYKAWDKNNELGVANNELTALKELLNETTLALIPLEQKFGSLSVTTNKAAETVTTALRADLEIIERMNSLPINPMLDKLISVTPSDLQGLKDRNDFMLELEQTVIRLQDEATSINFFNRFKDSRDEEATRIARLLHGQSAETDKLASERDKLTGERSTLTDEQSKYAQETAEYQAYADKINEIDKQLSDNLEETRIKFTENRKEGIQSVEDIAVMSADTISGLLGAVASNMEEGSKEFKAIKTVETIISTLTGSMKAYESMASIPYVGPFLGAAAAATVIATGAATISQIHATSPGSTSISTSASQMASAVPTVQTHSLGGEITTHQAADTKVYVLESDIKRTGQRVNVAESESRF